MWLKTVWEIITVVRLKDIEITEKVVRSPIANTKSGTIAGAVEKVLKNPPAFILFNPIEIVVPIMSDKTVVTTATKIVRWKLDIIGSFDQIVLYQSRLKPFQIKELLLWLNERPTTAVIGK